ncbi:hypothetical protein Tco_0996503 [Tanacetum coccineum]
MTMEILPEPTSYKLCDAPVLRTAITTTKPCQEDSSEFYLITGSIYIDQQGTVVFPMVAAAGRGQVRFIATCSYPTDIGTTLVEVILVIGHFVPSIVKVRPVDGASYKLSQKQQIISLKQPGTVVEYLALITLDLLKKASFSSSKATPDSYA